MHIKTFDLHLVFFCDLAGELNQEPTNEVVGGALQRQSQSSTENTEANDESAYELGSREAENQDGDHRPVEKLEEFEREILAPVGSVGLAQDGFKCRTERLVEHPRDVDHQRTEHQVDGERQHFVEVVQECLSQSHMDIRAEHVGNRRDGNQHDHQQHGQEFLEVAEERCDDSDHVCPPFTEGLDERPTEKQNHNHLGRLRRCFRNGRFTRGLALAALSWVERRNSLQTETTWFPSPKSILEKLLLD